MTRGKPKHTRYAPSIVGHPKTSDDWARLRDLRAAWVQAYGLAIGLGRGPENVAHYCSD